MISDSGEQAPCHGKKASDMMAFVIPAHRRHPAIGAAFGRFFRSSNPALPARHPYGGYDIRPVPLKSI
jgi:hypothetical protein